MKKLLLLSMMLATSMGLLAQGSSWQTATLINSGATKTGTFGGNDSEVWYKIVVPEEGQIEFQGFAEGVNFYAYYCIVYGYKNGDIYDRGHFTGNLLPGPGSKSDTITFKATDVGIGTYYIKLTSYPDTGPGTFRLYYKFTPCSLANDPEPNNDYEHSSLLASGSTVEGRLGYHTSDDFTDTEDWYKIVVPEEGQIELMATATGTVNFYAYYCIVYGYKNGDIYDRGHFTGNLLPGPGSKSDTITFKATDVGIGTYYIKLNRYNSTGGGGYKLYYKFTPCALAADPEPNNDYEHSSLLQSGKTVEGRLGYRTSDDVTDTEDWYKIVVPEEGQIELMATATGTVRFYPYYSTVNGYKNNDIYSRGSFTGNTSSASQTDTMTFKATDVGVGTYYIRINRYNSTGGGGYKLYYKFTPCALAADPEPNNDYEHSSLLQSGKTAEGRLGYRTSDDVTDTEDWYKIIVPEEGTIELMATATGTVRFYPSYSTVNGYKNNGIYSRGSFTGNTSSASQTDTMTFKATDVGPGTYYIRINRYNSTGGGGYRLYYKFTPCPLANDEEPNEDYEHAGWLPSGPTKQGRLGYRTSDDVTDNQDWYRFTVTKKGSIELTVTGTENLLLYRTNSCVYGLRSDGTTYSMGSFSASTSNYGSDTITYHANDIEKGTYYVKIYRYGGSGGYRLTYNGPTKTGDVDGTGRVGIDDVTSIITILLGGNTQGLFLDDADVDGNGRVSIDDVTALIQMLLDN